MIIEKEINDIIAKQLPAQVGEVLQKRLEQADKLEKEILSLKETIERKDTEITQLDKYRNIDRTLEQREQQLELREKAVKEAEVLKQVTELNIKLDEANKRAEIVQNLTSSLFRNTTYKENMNYSNHKNYYDANGNYRNDNESIIKNVDRTAD